MDILSASPTIIFVFYIKPNWKKIKNFCSPNIIINGEQDELGFRLKREQNIGYFILAILIIIVLLLQHIMGLVQLKELITPFSLAILILFLIKKQSSLLDYLLFIIGISFGNYQTYWISSHSFIPSEIIGLASGPPIILALTRSPFISGTLYFLNAIHTSYILKPRYIEFMGLSLDNHIVTSFSLSINHHLKYGFIMMIIIWLFLRLRRKMLAKLIKQKKCLEILNKNLNLTNTELEHIIQVKQDLFLSVTHEVRNPLNVISGSTQLALLNNPTPQISYHLNNIKESTDLVLFLIKNLLDFQKMEITDLEISRRSCNSCDFLDKIWNTSKILISKKGLHCEMFISKNMPEEIRLDKLRILQIIYNLVGNATKFTDKGYIGIICTWIEAENLENYMCFPTEEEIIRHYLSERVKYQKPNSDEEEFSSIVRSIHGSNRSIEIIRTIETIPIEKVFGFNRDQINAYQSNSIKTLRYHEILSRYHKLEFLNTHESIHLPLIKDYENKKSVGYLKIEVIDSGSGIEDKDLKNLFKKFGQAGKGSKKQLGTGLGLWIVKSLCLSMQGDLEVYSTFNKGSVFISLTKCY